MIGADYGSYRNYYLINHLVLITGLSDRTIRNHIASGILQGEKINGLWHFMPEQAERFIDRPAVHPGLLAKSKAAGVLQLVNDSAQEQSLCSFC